MHTTHKLFLLAPFNFILHQYGFPEVTVCYSLNDSRAWLQTETQHLSGEYVIIITQPSWGSNVIIRSVSHSVSMQLTIA